MSIQVTHMKGLPRNINYWDYTILCRCVKHAGSVLQRMEFWDGTKAGGNVHAEQINDQLIEAGKQPTQDTSRFVYKSREELAWEMLDTCSERTTYDLLDYLSNTLHLLNTRRNPYKAFDRTIQYEFQSTVIQERLNQLNAIVKHFIALGRQLRPVLYAIEQLTQEGYYIYRVEKDGALDGKGDLTIEEVTTKLRAIHEQLEKDTEGCKQVAVKGEKRYKPVLPNFMRIDLARDEQLGFGKDSDLPLCKSAQSSVQENTMDCANLHDALCKSAQAIPVITNSNNNTDNNTVKESTEDTALSSTDETPLTQSSLSELTLTDEQATPPSSEENKQESGNSPIASDSAKDTSSSKEKDAPAEPPTEKQGKGNKGGKGKGSQTIELTPEQVERRREWQKRINENRGGPLRERGKCINETTCIGQLVKEFNDDEIADIFHYLATKHWKFTKNPHAISGKDILDESHPTLKLLKDGPQKSNGSLNEQRTKTGIKTSVHVGSSMPPQKPAPTQEELEKIEALKRQMGITSANKQQSKMIS